MKAIVHGGILALLVGVLADSARADYIAAETLLLRPEVPHGAGAPTSFNFGASAQFTTDGSTDPLVVPLKLNGPSQTFFADASNPYFAPTVAVLTNGSNPWVHWGVQAPPGTVAGGALVNSYNFFYRTPTTTTLTPPSGAPVDLLGATINDIKLTINHFTQIGGNSSVDVYSVNATVTFEGSPGPVVVTPGVWDFAPPAPTPEPSSLVLAGFGAAGMLGFARRGGKRRI